MNNPDHDALIAFLSETAADGMDELDLIALEQNMLDGLPELAEEPDFNLAPASSFAA